MIQLNQRDTRPIYQQVYDQLRRLMVTGALAPDEKLPSVRTLATQLAINPNTIQRSYAQLEQEGYVYSVAGKGSFVSGDGDAHAHRRAELLTQFDQITTELRQLGMDDAQLLAHLKGGNHI